MPTVLSDRCPKCGKLISYTAEAAELRCPFCDHSFLVVEFARERLKMEQAEAESKQAREALATAEAEKADLQARLNDTLTALEALKDVDVKSSDILASLKADRKTHDAMAELLGAIQQGQQSGQDALSQLIRAMMREQTDASGKLSAVQELAAQILRAQQSGAEAVGKMQDEILERIETLDMKARDRVSLFNHFCEWSESMQKADVQRLQTLQGSSDALLQGQQAMTAKLDGLSDAISYLKDDVSKGFDELRKQRLDTLIELYHQATGLQLERKFDKAEETYRKLLATGGADAQDAEIYWRMLLCHYGVEYQDENGKTIPIILRPDLADPSTMQVRRDLSEHIKNNQQRAHYAKRLKQIDAYLKRYREVRMNPAWEFDVFISVKQKDEGHFTHDSDAASELYNYFIQDPMLAAKKLRVFNSRCTPLPVGEVFEPYIISALMSAKVLIVVGSTPEYMESQWVKNEWSRFQYLQEDERKRGKQDRRLFCYLTGGMEPKDLPLALNPDKQVLTEGPKTGFILREIMDKAFPDKGAPAPAPGPSTESPEIIANRMKAWLKLGLYQKVIDRYEDLSDTSPEILMGEPWLCLYTLCARTQLSAVELLATATTDLRADPLYKIAYEVADTALRARLDALWGEKNEKPAEPRQEDPDAPQEITYPEGKYVGQIVDGKRHGRGVFTWTNGSKYDGEWANGKCNGKGVYTWADGDRYEGEWLDNKFNGSGILTRKDGSRYAGEWKGGLFNGKGVMYYSEEDVFNRAKYDGQWRRGVRTGKGVMTWKDGSRYEGEWQNGKFNGQGVYYKANGTKTEGKWKDDKLVYDDQWENDKRNGPGATDHPVTPQGAGPSAGPNSAAEQGGAAGNPARQNPPAERKSALTKSSAWKFWCSRLPGINGSALLLPQLTQDQITAAQEDLGMPMDQHDRDALGVIHVKQGLFKGNTVLIVTQERLYINTNNWKASPPRAMAFRDIKQAKTTEQPGHRHQLEIITNSGERLSFSNPKNSVRDTLNLEALASAINQFIHQFQL